MVGKNLTVTQLERMLLRKTTVLEKLRRQRALLEKKLAHVERRIVEIGGVARERGTERVPRRRPKNPMTLLAAVIEMLGQHKKGLSLRELAGKLLDSGYKTSSTNFQNTLYQCLYHNSGKILHDAKAHIYRIK
jgi:hypothetical protein